ncbi:MAG: hypothetical protein AAGF54_06820 [Pseudomonadota bacterium]
MKNLNTGFKKLRFSSDTLNEEEYTIVVSGLGRSGTSMVSKMISSAGIFMGVSENDVIHEDIGLSVAFENNDAETYRRLIGARNAKHTVWGFKRPLILRKYHEMESALRNVRYVVIYRDPLAVAMRNQLSLGMNMTDSLSVFSNQFASMLEPVAKSSRPTLLLSYEKFLLKPRVMSGALANFIGRPEMADVIRSHVRPNDKSYREKTVAASDS